MGDSSPTSHSTLCVTPVVCGSCADGIGRHTERRISAPRAYDIMHVRGGHSNRFEISEHVPDVVNIEHQDVKKKLSKRTTPPVIDNDNLKKNIILHTLDSICSNLLQINY